MERFLDSVFPFLVVVAFVGIRIVAMVRRRRRHGQRSASAAPPRSPRGFVPWENEFRDSAPAGDVPAHTAAVGDDEEDFSAWNLSVDDEPLPQPPPPVPPPRIPEAPRLAAPALSLAVPFSPPENASPPPRRAEPDRLTQRFRGLSPLQQGVVWAEILGVPRGLED
jgi:hypothetical protein